jgi:hypothetical protein
MAYEKEFFHLRWREKKREKLQGGASAAGGFSSAGDWRWFPPLQTSECPYQIP